MSFIKQIIFLICLLCLFESIYATTYRCYTDSYTFVDCLYGCAYFNTINGPRLGCIIQRSDCYFNVCCFSDHCNSASNYNYYKSLMFDQINNDNGKIKCYHCDKCKTNLFRSFVYCEFGCRVEIEAANRNKRSPAIAAIGKIANRTKRHPAVGALVQILTTAGPEIWSMFKSKEKKTLGCIERIKDCFKSNVKCCLKSKCNLASKFEARSHIIMIYCIFMFIQLIWRNT